MTKLTTLDLAPFYRSTIGIDRLFDRIVHQLDHASTQPNYPPYNIVETGEHSWEVQLAVAGFSQSELDVTVTDGDLVITGEKTDSIPEGHVYRHQGISARRFIRTFQLGEYVEVESAIAKDGVLTVKIQQIIPESAKPKKIAINYQSNE